MSTESHQAAAPMPDAAAGELQSDDLQAFVRKFDKELAAGITALTLLGVLGEGVPLYGYQIATRLERDAGGALAGKQGALYPVLRGLEAAGLLRSEVQASSSGPPRRYYQITALGREALAQCTTRWRATRRIVDTILGGEHA